VPPLLNALQQCRLGKLMLQRAVTHRSFSADNNERLEFLCDSVLNLAISSLLYQRLSSMPEGDLLRLGEGESKSGGKQRPSILADAVEALIGAVYLDAGYAAGEKVVHHLFEGVDINPHMRAAEKDAKTALQEWLQGRRMKLPQYEVVATTGAAHRQTFEVACAIAELQLQARGTGASRRAAEQTAATAMLELLKARHA
jgi:ribonuclease III